MTYNPRPTRAEVSDVGNAVLDGADCVMLSGETAKGSYPLESVRLMAETVLLAEQTIFYPNLFNEIRLLTPRPTATTETVCCAAVSASLEQDAKAIIVITTRSLRSCVVLMGSGDTARLVSKYRPSVPIITVTRNFNTSRNCHLYRGVYPCLYPKSRPGDSSVWQEDVDNRLHWAMEYASFQKHSHL
jgi:pyruvate kinase